MKRLSERESEDLLQEGIRQIRAGLRTMPDQGLYDRINSVLTDREEKAPLSRVAKGVLSDGITRPLVKIGYTITAGAAAVIAGILVGNLFYSGDYTNEKEAYIQEITMQSSDMSGLSAQLINYYNEDNP